jgi:hypothetical protein
MNRKTVPGRGRAAPSWPTPVANRITATESPTTKTCNGLLQQNLPKADIDHSIQSPRWRYPWALSTSPPTVTGLPAICAKAMTHGTVPLFTQLWMVPRWTSTSPALRCTLVARDHCTVIDRIGAVFARGSPGSEAHHPEDTAVVDC